MDKDLAITRVLGTLTQLASPAGRPGARMLPLGAMQEAFGRFLEYAEELRGDEHVDAGRHVRAASLVREIAPLLGNWTLDAVPREVTLAARRAIDAWFPENGGAEHWEQTDRDAERWAASAEKGVLSKGDDPDPRASRDEHLLQMASSVRQAAEDENPDRREP